MSVSSTGIGYRLDGPAAAPVLVLSPSLGTTTSLWERTLPRFAARCRVLRHDLPGHGASPPPEGPVRVESIARSLLALLDELGIDRALYCGVSLGGMIGLWLGANAAERFERLALCCTGAKIGDRDTYFERAELVRHEGAGVTIAGARERWFTPGFRDDPEARRLLGELAAVPPAGYAACCEAVGEWDFRDRLAEVAPPTLALFGAEDPVTPALVRDELAAIPESTAVVLDGAAHLACAERPDAFATAVLHHLEGGDR